METFTSSRDLPLFFSIFIFVYLIGYLFIFRRWSPESRPLASSCLMSLLHGVAAVVLSTRALVSNPNRGFSSPNNQSQNSVLDFSSAYFFADLLHLSVFPSPAGGDSLFAAHHAAVLFVFLTCRYLVAHGACALLALLIIAEATSVCQNSWTLADARGPDAPLAVSVHRFVTLPFYASYSVCRCVLAPLLIFKMTWFYVSGGADDVIPRWVWVSWTVVIFTAVTVSILWIWNLWVLFFQEKYSKFAKKMK
ncbi:TLC domain-containing protein [Cardamine amara subsp. amara]|uniref:TLC domain-containing protein n=1 Tax=Cardamine amara subsp. amara TaxID=228776 RepID=A0ABD0ZHS0_CARAN